LDFTFLEHIAARKGLNRHAAEFVGASPGLTGFPRTQNTGKTAFNPKLLPTKGGMKKTVLSLSLGLISSAALQAAPAGGWSDELTTPFRVEADGAAINVEIGHAAPLVTDFDGDGVFDLLVGQFGGGKLRIYRNKGDNSNPKFDTFAWFQAGGKDGTVPAG
jgi:hypothetical protein